MRPTPLFLLLLAAASTGCPDEYEVHGEPRVSFAGTVELATPVPTKTGAELVISFGAMPVDTGALVGEATWVLPYDGAVLTPSSFPASFDIGDLGLPYSGQGIAVYDLAGDGIIDESDLVGELSFGAGEFDDQSQLRGLIFLLDVAAP